MQEVLLSCRNKLSTYDTSVLFSVFYNTLIGDCELTEGEIRAYPLPHLSNEMQVMLITHYKLKAWQKKIYVAVKHGDTSVICFRSLNREVFRYSDSAL